MIARRAQPGGVPAMASPARSPAHSNPQRGGFSLRTVALLGLTLLATAPGVADATAAFRYATISWEPNTEMVSGVDFHFEAGVKLNFPWGFNNGEEWRASTDEEFKKYTNRNDYPECGDPFGGDAFWTYAFLDQGLNPVPLGDVPSGCTVITKRLEPGYELLLTQSTGLSCADPFTVYDTEDCDESYNEFGWANGDGSRKDVTLRIHSTLEDDSALGNYAIGESFFTHEYTDIEQTYVAYFRSHRQNDLNYRNNARGIFRVEAQVAFVARNKSPVVRMMPVLPVVSNGFAVTRFSIPAYDPEGEALTFTFASREQYGGLVGNFTEIALSVQSTTPVVTTQGNDFGGNNTHDNMPDTPAFMSWLNAATGTINWRTSSLEDGLYNLAVQVSDGASYVTAQFGVYLFSYSPSFCHRECETDLPPSITERSGTAADPDGVYDTCNVCKGTDTLQSDYSFCTPVRNSINCPGTPALASPPPPSPSPPMAPGVEASASPTASPVVESTAAPTTGIEAAPGAGRRHLLQEAASLVPTADACLTSGGTLKFVYPTPGYNEDDEEADSVMHEERVERGAGFEFSVTVYDDDVCAEQRLEAMGMPKGASLTVSSEAMVDDYGAAGYVMNAGQKRTTYTFSYPSFTANPLNDKRPESQLVCFYASDKYMAVQHCVKLIVNPLERRDEQVLVRFGCYTGLLWNPKPVNWAEVPKPWGKFCFFDNQTDLSNTEHIATYCSASSYESQQWHHATVTLDGAGGGKLLVDGHVESEFTTGGTTVDCSPPVVRRSRRLQSLAPSDGEAAAADAASSSSRALLSDHGGEDPDPDPVPCACSARVAQACEIRYVGFRGLVDEIAIFPAALSVEEINTKMFGMASGLPTPRQGLGQATPADYAEGALAYYKFDTPCAAPIADAIEPTPLADWSDVVAYYGREEYGLVDSSATGAYGGSAFSPYGGDTFAYAAAPWNAPVVVEAMGPGNATDEMMTQLPTDSSPARLSVVGAAPSPFLTCTADPGPMFGTEATPGIMRVGVSSQHVTQWRAAPATVLTAGVVDVGLGAGAYWGATEIACSVSSSTVGANLHVGVSNDGGLSRGAAAAVTVGEMALQLDGNGYVDVSQLLTGEEMNVQYTVGAWVLPSCENDVPVYAMAFARANAITSGMMYDATEGSFDGVWQTQPVTGGPFAAVCGEWHFITIVSQATSNFDARGGGATNGYFYVDGVSQGWSVVGGTTRPMDDNLYIGGSALGQAGTKMKGWVDDVRVYTAALTPTEVAELMWTEPLNLLAGSLTPSLVGYYRFSDGSGTVVKDVAGVVTISATVRDAGSSAFVPKAAPWEPTLTTAASAVVGGLGGGENITVHGSGFAASVFLKCVWGALEEGDELTLPECAPGVDCSAEAGRRRPDGVASPLVVTAAATVIDAVTSPATWVSETEVTCTTPPMAATGAYRLAVTNKPNGQPHAISSSVVFQVKETVLELDCVESHVDVSAVVADAALSSYTVAVWAKPSATGNDPLASVWAFQGVDGEGDLAMMAYATSKGFFYFDDNILDGRAGAAAADQWHHLVVTMTAAGRGQLLVNDAPAVTFSTTSRAVAGGKFLLGAHLVDGAAADAFCGQLDELLVLGDALSPTAAATWAATLQLDLSPLSVISYLRFNEPADAASATPEAGSSRDGEVPLVGDVTRVYTQTPALPATVLAVSPVTAPVAYTGEVVISGGNFAASPYTTCSLGDDVVACEVSEDGTVATVAASTAAPVAGPLLVGLNYGTTANSFATMERVVTSGDVRVGLSAFIDSFAPEATTLPGRLAIPNTAASFSPEHPLTVVVQDGDAAMGGGGPGDAPSGGGPMASRRLLSAELSMSRRQLAGHEVVTTVAAWIKLDAIQPEAAGLSGRDLGLLGVGSWRLYALVHPAMTLYSATGEETDPVRATVYGALLTELDAAGTLGTSGYSGAVDQVWRWDRALSAAEVSGLFRFGHFALDFFATPATVTVPLPPVLVDSTALTAKLWVRSEAVEGLQALLSVPAKDAPLFSAVWFGVVNGRPAVAIRAPCEVEPCSSVWETSASFAVVQEGVWVHLTFTVDTATDSVMVLADGLPVLTATLPADLALLPLADDLLLGSNPVDAEGVSAYAGGGGARTFKGSIFDLKLQGAYDMHTTDAECTQPSSDVAAYYPLNDGYGPPVELLTGARGSISNLEVWVRATDMAPEDGSRFHHFDLTGSFATPVDTVGCLTVSALDKCGAQLMDGELTAADVTVGMDTMGLSPRVEVLPMGADGTTAVCYSSDTCGRYSLSLLGGEYEGEIAVIPGAVVPADSTYSQVSGSPGIEETCEATNSFVVVTLKDANGCTASGFDAPLVGMVYGPQDKLEIAATPTEEEGVYRIEYVPEAAGTYFVEAWYAGELVGGVGVTATHCSGRSVFLDGFSAVEVDEAEGGDALDLADTPLTLMAWVKRGPEGEAPAPPAPPPTPPPAICPGGEPRVDGSCVPARHRRHLLQNPLQISNGDDELRYVFFKGGWEQHPDEDSQRQQLGSDIKGYYLGFSADYSTLEGGVYVAGQGINNAGEYRSVRSTRQLDPALELVDCSTGAPACTRNDDNGWMHVAMTYDGTSLKLFTNGVVNGQQSWPDVKFGKPNDYYHPLSIGLGFAGQVDEVRIYSEAVDFSGETRLYCPVKMSPAQSSLVAYMPFNEGRGDATAVFSATSSAFGSFAQPPGEEAPRAGWATKPRPGSLVGSGVSPAFSTAVDATPDARYLASDDYTTAILHVTVRDECDFVHPTTSAALTATAEPLAYVHDGLEHLPDALFADTVGAGASQTMPSRVVSTAVGDKWGPHALQLSTTLAGVYAITVGLAGGGALALTQPLQSGIRVMAAAADAQTSELLGSMRYDTLVGVPSSVTVQAKDAFGNEAQVGGEVWQATSSVGVHVTGVTDYGDGKYQVAFVASAPSAQRASVTLAVNGGEQNSGSLPVGGASTSGLPVKMFGLGDDEGVPGRRVEHAATAVGSDLYVFGGVDGAEKTYNAQLWKGAFAGPYMYGMRTATVAAATEAPGGSDRIGRLTKLTVDTTDSHINADCSDLRLTDAAGTKLSFWIDPIPGCKATDTVLYVNGLTGEGDYHLFYWAPSAPTASDGAATFDVFHDFEDPLATPDEVASACAQSAPEGLFAPVAAHTPSGHSALYVDPTAGGHGDLTIDVSGAMAGVDGANYYLRAYFYDSGAADAAHLVVLQGADCGDRLQVGVQSAWSGGSFYVARANGEDTYGFPDAEASAGGVTPKMTRSVGWHLIEMWDDGSAGGGAVLALDGTYVTLPVARDASRQWRVTPSAVILRSGVLGGAANAAPALWDAVAFTAGAAYGVGGATLGTPATMVWASNGGWEAMSPAGRPPPARMAGTLTATLNANSSSVVLVSGERSGFAFNDVWAYHPTEDRWSWTDPLSVPGRMPAPRFDHSTVSVGDKVYVFGGRATGSGAAFGDVWMYNTATAEWYDVTPASQPPGSAGRPPALWGHSAVEMDGKMLVFGGFDAASNACVSDVWEFDLHLQRWAKHSLASTVAPRARYGHTAVAYDGKMNVLGGASESFEQFPTWWQYDPRARLWVQVGAGTDVGGAEGFYSHSASLVGDGGFQAGMLLFGGQGNGGYKAELKLYPLYKV